MTRLLRRLRCALGMHRWATLYAPTEDGPGGCYRRTVTCLFCTKETTR